MNLASISPELLLEQIFTFVRAHRPPSVSADYLERFIHRHRAQLLATLTRQLRGEPAPPKEPGLEWQEDMPGELWSPAQRTELNLRAMNLLATKPVEALTDHDRRILAAYSGWGGLSLEKVAHLFPAEFPAPDARALIHEYYTPSGIANDVAALVGGLMLEVKRVNGRFRVLEPSAGIGRFVRALSRLRRANTLAPFDWTIVELSSVSARLLMALYPGFQIHNMPFEHWLRRHFESSQPRFQFIVANPPYGPRGALISEDSEPFYKVKQAYLYFLLRSIGLLAEDGIAIFLIPAGFMTSSRHQKYREHVFKRCHLMTAFRLPSQGVVKRDPIFPGANLVTDLIVLRSRGGTLAETLPDDLPIVEGRFFSMNPQLILGQEFNGGEVNDDHTIIPRYRYAVIGEYTGLPRAEFRPLQNGVMIVEEDERRVHRGGIVRDVREEENLPPELQSATRLGMRFDKYLASLARPDSADASQTWQELTRDIETWKQNFGAPQQRQALLALAQRGNVGANRFLTAFKPDGSFAETLRTAPKFEPVYSGGDNLLARAEWTFRKKGNLTLAEVASMQQTLTGNTVDNESLKTLMTSSGWCLDGEQWNQLVYHTIYYTGDLWPKVDRCVKRGLTDPQAALQHKTLMGLIQPSLYEDIVQAGITPRDSWIPVELLEKWINKRLASPSGIIYHGPVRLERTEGVLTLLDKPYSRFSDDTFVDSVESEYGAPLVWFIGWSNNHLSLFRPPRERERSYDEVRLEISNAWISAFQLWIRENSEIHSTLEDAYNRTLKGYIAPTYPSEPVHIARWAPDGPKLYDYQWRSVRRIVANRSGLLAFDVGLGKTYTGIAVLARARQEGWARRPVVLVPNSIVWKWFRDFKRCLPDYTVLVIGSNRKIVTTGPRKGTLIAEPDLPSERAAKWSAFQSGQADVVLLTYSALGRTKVDEEMLADYVGHVTAIQRQLTLDRARKRKKKKEDEKDRRESGSNKFNKMLSDTIAQVQNISVVKGAVLSKGLTERQEATLEEKSEAWLAEKLEANARWEYDPGIEWHSLGIDYLMIDESQNFKNLFMPEEREGGLPDAMGGTTESKRAWQLDFRCASVRKHTGGTGVVLLSATPAKNGPLEFYNALHLINPKAWEAVGISDPESFIGQFCQFEPRRAITAEGVLVTRLACTAFRNLDVLRGVVFRYADFKTAEDVGLKIPDAINFEHRVDLDETQNREIRARWVKISDLREKMRHMGSDDGAREAVRLKIMALAAEVDLVAIHPYLPRSNKLTKEELEALDPHSAKFDSVADQIMATDESVCSKDDPKWCLNCGHVVFVENIAAHLWLQRVFIERGIPAHRIAVLNAEAAADPETRQQIAEKFNGTGKPSDEDHVPPAYDIVIANAVAYEGVDLQRRTCAIHHIDLPWEPATLQQRNGRGVRQGNTFERVKIHYYIGRPSGDGRRLSLIDKKRSWLTSLVSGQDRITNNPSASVEISLEDMLIDIAPPEERERMLRDRAFAIAEQERKVRERTSAAGNDLLRQASLRFRRAAALSAQPGEAQRYRDEGEAFFTRLARLDANAWPWLTMAYAFRERTGYIPKLGPPLLVGCSITLSAENVAGILARRDKHILHVGDSTGAKVGLRYDNELVWKPLENEDVDRLVERLDQSAIRPGPPEIPDSRLKEMASRHFVIGQNWEDLHFELADPAWLERVWPVIATEVVSGILKHYRHSDYKRLLPLVHEGRLKLLTEAEAYNGSRFTNLPVLPPTHLGYYKFLELAPATGLKWKELQRLSLWWWNRSIPYGLLEPKEPTPPSPQPPSQPQLAALRMPRPRYYYEEERR